MQGICDLCKVLDETSIVSNEANETLDSCVHHGFGIYFDGFKIIPAWPHTFQCYTVPQVLNLFLEKLTFQRFEF